MWAASAGDELAKANAAIDLKEVIDQETGECRLEENTLPVPKSVRDKRGTFGNPKVRSPDGSAR